MTFKELVIFCSDRLSQDQLQKVYDSIPLEVEIREDVEVPEETVKLAAGFLSPQATVISGEAN